MYISRKMKIICFLLFFHTNLQQSQGRIGKHTPVYYNYLYGMKDVIYSQPGDIYLGEIADVYPSDNVVRCQRWPFREVIADVTESMKYAVDWVNKQPDLLPNITLGFVLKGSCPNLPMVLAHSLSFLPRTEKICNDVDCYRRPMLSPSNSQYITHDIIGMVAPAKSTMAAGVSSLYTKARIPLVGYAAGSRILGSYFHPYFSRVNTKDPIQVRAILKFISDNGWTYIQYVYRDDDYGRDAAKYMTDKAGDYGVCVAGRHMLNNYRQNAIALLKKPLARVVVVFIIPYRFGKLHTELYNLNGTGHFIWIGSDRFEPYRGHKDPKGTEYPGNGAFTVFSYSNIVREFYEYLRNVNVLKTKNPWLKFEWQKAMDCSYARKTCPQNMTHLYFNPLKDTSLRMDAVLAFAHAAHNLVQEQCPGAKGKKARACIKGELLLEYLKKVKYEGFNGPIDLNRQTHGKFTIRQLEYGYKGNIFFPSTFKRMYDKDIALYDGQHDTITYLDNPISWTHLKIVKRLAPVSNDSPLKDVPESVCSRPCVAGEYKIEKDLPCCWDCLRCRENERIINENTECEACPIFQWPDPMSDFTTCVDIPLTYQTTKDPIPIALVFVAVFALALTLFVYLAYIKYRNERVIKASSKELSFIQLVGISVGYITVILFQTTPTDIMCACIFFLFCMSFCMLYSPLLVKTVRIFRIFRSASDNQKPRLISPQSQLTISVSLITVQLLLCGVVYLVYVPGARRTQPVWSEKMVELSCDFTIPGLASFLGYTIMLVSLCSVFAFMVRKLPDNYNESRFISMCVSTTLLIWMAFVPTYFTSFRQYLRMFLLCMALLLNHSVALFLLFFPRIYGAFAIKK